MASATYRPMLADSLPYATKALIAPASSIERVCQSTLPGLRDYIVISNRGKWLGVHHPVPHHRGLRYPTCRWTPGTR